MSHRCYIGVTDPHLPHLVRARFVLRDGHPAAIVPTLARIWADHAGRDTGALVAAILRHDWAYLDTTVRDDGRRTVPAVGVPLHGTSSEPVTVFAPRHAADLDVGWVYVIDPATDTVTVHGDDGGITRCRLDLGRDTPVAHRCPPARPRCRARGWRAARYDRPRHAAPGAPPPSRATRPTAGIRPL
ncbi:hypothetical protein [Micromonospora fluostatini]|uniref:hypothetical protein n=1 Tax=Micromonospora sp. JCM 30529 TaxID=3421643 RepID=UPI003D1827B0